MSLLTSCLDDLSIDENRVLPAHQVLVPVGAPDSVPVAPLPGQLSAVARSAVDDGPSAWALHPMGDQKHLAPAIGSARCAGCSMPATAAIGG